MDRCMDRSSSTGIACIGCMSKGALCRDRGMLLACASYSSLVCVRQAHDVPLWKSLSITAARKCCPASPGVHSPLLTCCHRPHRRQTAPHLNLEECPSHHRWPRHPQQVLLLHDHASCWHCTTVSIQNRLWKCIKQKYVYLITTCCQVFGFGNRPVHRNWPLVNHL